MHIDACKQQIDACKLVAHRWLMFDEVIDEVIDYAPRRHGILVVGFTSKIKICYTSSDLGNRFLGH
jgi:hypothetical protein